LAKTIDFSAKSILIRLIIFMELPTVVSNLLLMTVSFFCSLRLLLRVSLEVKILLAYIGVGWLMLWVEHGWQHAPGSNQEWSVLFMAVREIKHLSDVQEWSVWLMAVNTTPFRCAFSDYFKPFNGLLKTILQLLWWRFIFSCEQHTTFWIYLQKHNMWTCCWQLNAECLLATVADGEMPLITVGSE
jgi:hypothetical protein